MATFLENNVHLCCVIAVKLLFTGVLSAAFSTSLSVDGELYKLLKSKSVSRFFDLYDEELLRMGFNASNNLAILSAVF